MSLRPGKSLDKWFDAHEKDILHVQTILAQCLPDEPGKLDLMLRDVDAWYEAMNSCYADALTFYDDAKRRALVSRGEKVTDLDREIIMRSETTDERRLMVTLEGIVEAIKSRLILGMSLRKAYVGEGQAGHRTET